MSNGGSKLNDSRASFVEGMESRASSSKWRSSRIDDEDSMSQGSDILKELN